jgi:hypothetical protein
MTGEEFRAWEERKKHRSRVDVRGVKLTPLNGCILEVEDALQKFWANFQDQPDEIVVDSLSDLTDLLVNALSLAERDKMIFVDGKPFRDHMRLVGAHWRPLIREYRSKWSIDPVGGIIPVFENL